MILSIIYFCLGTAPALSIYLIFHNSTWDVKKEFSHLVARTRTLEENLIRLRALEDQGGKSRSEIKQMASLLRTIAQATRKNCAFMNNYIWDWLYVQPREHQNNVEYQKGRRLAIATLHKNTQLYWNISKILFLTRFLPRRKIDSRPLREAILEFIELEEAYFTMLERLRSLEMPSLKQQ